MKSAVGLLVISAALASSAHADVVIDFDNFDSTAGLTLVGSAAAAATGDGNVLRLTPASGSKSAAAYSTTPITLGANATFSTTFKFRFTEPGGWDPADGITFVLAAAPSGLGSSGVGMGYQGVKYSVAIEFDTYNNAGYGLGANDGNSSNHVSIDTGGDLQNSFLQNVYGNASCGFPSGGNPNQNDHSVFGCMSNGHIWSVSIGYDGSAISLKLQDGAGPAFFAYDDVPIDIASHLGTNQAYVGFTSGTGAGWENHDILSWQFANTTELTPPVPEPSSYALLLIGLGAIGVVVRRRHRLTA